MLLVFLGTYPLKSSRLVEFLNIELPTVVKFCFLSGGLSAPEAVIAVAAALGLEPRPLDCYLKNAPPPVDEIVFRPCLTMAGGAPGTGALVEAHIVV